MSKRDEYVEKMKHQLDALNAQLTELEAKGEAAQKEFREKHQEQIAQLREHYISALAKMDEIKSASEEKWESLVVEGEKVHKAFVHSVNYFKSQLKK
jgi:predicted  nucleic acid-binding Zn-ribbon protein